MRFTNPRTLAAALALVGPLAASAAEINIVVSEDVSDLTLDCIEKASAAPPAQDVVVRERWITTAPYFWKCADEESDGSLASTICIRDDSPLATVTSPPRIE